MKLSPQSYGKVLYELTKDASKKDLDKIVEQFIIFLSQEQVLSKMDYIIKEFVDYAKEQTGIAQLKVTSARKLSEEEIDEISKQFSDKAEVETEVDKKLLGGVKVKTKNTILDGSLRMQIQKLEKKLKS